MSKTVIGWSMNETGNWKTVNTKVFLDSCVFRFLVFVVLLYKKRDQILTQKKHLFLSRHFSSSWQTVTADDQISHVTFLNTPSHRRIDRLYVVFMFVKCL